MRQPLPLLRALVGPQVRQPDEAALALEAAEHGVLVRSQGPVQGAELGRGRDAACEGLRDVDVRVAVPRVLLDRDGHGGQADGGARQPGYALQGEDGVGGGGEGSVLERGGVG